MPKGHPLKDRKPIRSKNLPVFNVRVPGTNRTTHASIHQLSPVSPLSVLLRAAMERLEQIQKETPTSTRITPLIRALQLMGRDPVEEGVVAKIAS